MPAFSIVIPTYNRAAQAAAAIRSVLAQTDGDLECLVVDDGSRDATREALAPFKDPRIKLTFNEKNHGQAFCRNQAIRAASGDWIAFLDSDDLFLPERLARLRQAAAAAPRAGFLFTNSYIHRYGRIIGLLFERDRLIPEGKLPGYYALGDKHLPYVTTMVAIRREAFRTVGLFREDLATHEDMELYGRMLEKGLEVKALTEPLAVRFIHAGQLTADHHLDFRGSMDALATCGAPPEVAREIRARVAREVAEYLWRAARPAEAREFLAREGGGLDAAFAFKTRLPAPVLLAGRLARELWLKARYHPSLAPADYRAADALVVEMLQPSATTKARDD